MYRPEVFCCSEISSKSNNWAHTWFVHNCILSTFHCIYTLYQT